MAVTSGASKEPGPPVEAEPRPRRPAGSFITGFTVFMRYVCMDALKCEDGDTATRRTIEDGIDVYAQSYLSKNPAYAGAYAGGRTGCTTRLPWRTANFSVPTLTTGWSRPSSNAVGKKHCGPAGRPRSSSAKTKIRQVLDGKIKQHAF